ncbi:MAG: VCBS repeat-containing protein [Myxococcota bacterium]
MSHYAWSSFACLTLFVLGGCFTDSVGPTDTGQTPTSGPSDTASDGVPSDDETVGATGSATGNTTPADTGADDTESADTADTETGDFCGHPQPVFAFNEPEIIDVGGTPFLMAVGDFIGQDGPDVAVANDDLLQVQILEGQGLLGAFDMADAIPLTVEASGVALGEFDGEPPLELLVTDRDRLLLYGTVPGDQNHLEERVGIDLLDRAWTMAVADMWGDEWPDIAINTHPMDSGVVEFLTGREGGMDVSQSSVPAGENTPRIAVADFDEDGRLDLVVPRTDSDGDLPGDYLTVLLNRSDGQEASFESSQVPTNEAPFGIEADDVDLDGHMDLVVSHLGGPVDGMDDELWILLGDGTGSFGSVQTLVVGDTLGQVAVEDMDCNGTLDIVVPSAGLGQIIILSGDDTGTFSMDDSVAFEVDGLVSDLEVVDFNLDGRLDIMASVIDQGELWYFQGD